MFSQSRLVYLVLALVIGVILFYFVGKWNSAVDDAASVEKCRISVERNAKLKIGLLRLDADDLECPVRKISIGENVKQEEAKEKIAREMYTCWRQFGRGKLDLFRDDGVYCKVCSIIDLETDEDISGFSEYLLTTPSPTAGLYYYDYLSSFETSRAEEVVGKKLPVIGHDGKETENTDKLQSSDSLGTDKKYAVIFVYAKGSDSWKKIKDQLSNGVLHGSSIIAGVGVGSGVAGLAIGATLFIPGVNLAVVGVAAGTFGLIATVSAIQTAAWMLKDDNVEWFAFNVLKEWNDELGSEALEKFECGNLLA